MKINKSTQVFLAVFMFALILRLICLNIYIETNMYHPFSIPGSDSEEYFKWARDIETGRIIGSTSFMKWPLYAYLTGLFFKVFGPNLILIYFIQIILGALNCALISLITNRLFKSDTQSFVAGILASVYGLFIFYDMLFVYVTLSLFLNLLFFLFCIHIEKSLCNRITLFFSGIFLGIAALAQANILLFGIFSIFWILWRKGSKGTIFAYNAVSFMIGLIIALSPAFVHNYIAERDFVPLAGNLGINFYAGNNPDSTGLFYLPDNFTSTQEGMFRDSRILAEHASSCRLKTSRVSAFWFNKTLNDIKHNPLVWIKLFLKKWLLIFTPLEFVHDSEFVYSQNKIWFLKSSLSLIKFILPFAILGIILNLRKIKKLYLAYSWVGFFSLSISLFYVCSRYRIILVPFFIIFSSSAIIYIFNVFIQRKYLKGIIYAAAVIAILGLSELETSVVQRIPRNTSMLDILLKQIGVSMENRNYLDVQEKIQAAKKIAPLNLQIMNLEGSLYYQLGDFKKAEKIFKNSLKIYPLSFDLYYNLGLIYDMEGFFEDAVIVLEKAVFLYPSDPASHFELGIAYKNLGKNGRALEEFNLALNKINPWRTSEIEQIKGQIMSFNRNAEIPGF